MPWLAAGELFPSSFTLAREVATDTCPCCSLVPGLPRDGSLSWPLRTHHQPGVLSAYNSRTALTLPEVPGLVVSGSFHPGLKDQPWESAADPEGRPPTAVTGAAAGTSCSCTPLPTRLGHQVGGARILSKQKGYDMYADVANKGKKEQKFQSSVF